MARYDDLDTTAIAYTTFISTIILLVIILLGRALCYSWLESVEEEKLTNAHYTKADQAIGEQQAVLNGYERVQVELPGMPDANNPGAEVKPQLQEKVRIPIDKAKQLLLGELSAEPSA